MLEESLVRNWKITVQILWSWKIGSVVRKFSIFIGGLVFFFSSGRYQSENTLQHFRGFSTEKRSTSWLIVEGLFLLLPPFRDDKRLVLGIPFWNRILWYDLFDPLGDKQFDPYDSDFFGGNFLGQNRSTFEMMTSWGCPPSSTTWCLERKPQGFKTRGNLRGSHPWRWWKPQYFEWKLRNHVMESVVSVDGFPS